MSDKISQTTEFSFMLKPSTIEGAGVGVFAVHHIPAGAKAFMTSFSIRRIKRSLVPTILAQYCLLIDDEEMLCPTNFGCMEIGWYINHSDKPNIAHEKTIPLSELTLTDNEINTLKPRPFIAIRDIKAGEEILLDYNSLGEPEHLKESYYKR